MKTLIKSGLTAGAIIGSLCGSLAATAQGRNLQLESCIYNCGKGDGSGGVSADEFAQCKAFCEEIYGDGRGSR